jgi:toluene monooxygenase system ferredoxin subunit
VPEQAMKRAADPGRAEAAGTSVVWHEAVELDELWSGDLVGLNLGGTKVLLVKIDEEIRAYEDRCPHQSTLLSEGMLEGSTLTCSAHLWEFDVMTGAGVNPKRSCLNGFVIAIRDDIVHVGIPCAHTVD